MYWVGFPRDKTSTLKTSILKWVLDFGQNTKVVRNILKFMGVKFGDIPTSFDRLNPHRKTV